MLPQAAPAVHDAPQLRRNYAITNYGDSALNWAVRLIRPVGLPPFVKQLAPDAELGGHRREPFASLDPLNYAVLELRRKCTLWLLRHVTFSEARVFLLACLTFGGHFTDRPPRATRLWRKCRERPAFVGGRRSGSRRKD
jgi:hypothetical protein